MEGIDTKELVAQIMKHMGTTDKEATVEALRRAIQHSDGEFKKKFQAFLTIVEAHEE